ncbi:hypothetical protein PR048_003389 [Dryococelus australis]|uniref:Uncharacterized protein n=1 Tax=Dryococelus australis TaxID=614101 RepID=A0ABQ9IPA3_9NEOP|nr:hypothetical protein PR048_003389 [Dryococelus australis]
MKLHGGVLNSNILETRWMELAWSDRAAFRRLVQVPEHCAKCIFAGNFACFEGNSSDFKRLGEGGGGIKILREIKEIQYDCRGSQLSAGRQMWRLLEFSGCVAYKATRARQLLPDIWDRDIAGSICSKPWDSVFIFKLPTGSTGGKFVSGDAVAALQSDVISVGVKDAADMCADPANCRRVLEVVVELVISQFPTRHVSFRLQSAAQLFRTLCRTAVLPYLRNVDNMCCSEEVSLDLINNMRDEASPHFNMADEEYLCKQLPDRWMGRGRPVAYPRSSDVAALRQRMDRGCQQNHGTSRLLSCASLRCDMSRRALRCKVEILSIACKGESLLTHMQCLIAPTHKACSVSVVILYCANQISDSNEAHRLNYVRMFVFFFLLPLKEIMGARDVLTESRVSVYKESTARHGGVKWVVLQPTPYAYKDRKSCKETCITAERDWAAMACGWGHDYLPKLPGTVVRAEGKGGVGWVGVRLIPGHVRIPLRIVLVYESPKSRPPTPRPTNGTSATEVFASGIRRDVIEMAAVNPRSPAPRPDRVNLLFLATQVFVVVIRGRLTFNGPAFRTFEAEKRASGNGYIVARIKCCAIAAKSKPLILLARSLWQGSVRGPLVFLLVAVHDKARTFEINLAAKSLSLPTYILMAALSDMRPVKLVTMDGNDKSHINVVQVLHSTNERRNGLVFVCVLFFIAVGVVSDSSHFHAETASAFMESIEGCIRVCGAYISLPPRLENGSKRGEGYSVLRFKFAIATKRKKACSVSVVVLFRANQICNCGIFLHANTLDGLSGIVLRKERVSRTLQRSSRQQVNELVIVEVLNAGEGKANGNVRHISYVRKSGRPCSRESNPVSLGGKQELYSDCCTTGAGWAGSARVPSITSLKCKKSRLSYAIDIGIETCSSWWEADVVLHR